MVSDGHFTPLFWRAQFPEDVLDVLKAFISEFKFTSKSKMLSEHVIDGLQCRHSQGMIDVLIGVRISTRVAATATVLYYLNRNDLATAI